MRKIFNIFLYIYRKIDNTYSVTKMSIKYTTWHLYDVIYLFRYVFKILNTKFSRNMKSVHNLENQYYIVSISTLLPLILSDFEVWTLINVILQKIWSLEKFNENIFLHRSYLFPSIFIVILWKSVIQNFLQSLISIKKSSFSSQLDLI